tara:strand:+ start:676 stop:927 length:252 start_codon:yes stop_codon:yes gene_type:complete
MTIQTKYNLKKVYKGTVEDLKKELSVLTLENIKRYPGLKPVWDDFYEMWLRFGPDSARTILIPAIWKGEVPSPLEAKGERAES